MRKLIPLALAFVFTAALLVFPAAADGDFAVDFNDGSAAPFTGGTVAVDPKTNSPCLIVEDGGAAEVTFADALTVDFKLKAADAANAVAIGLNGEDALTIVNNKISYAKAGGTQETYFTAGQWYSVRLTIENGAVKFYLDGRSKDYIVNNSPNFAALSLAAASFTSLSVTGAASLDDVKAYALAQGGAGGMEASLLDVGFDGWKINSINSGGTITDFEYEPAKQNNTTQNAPIFSGLVRSMTFQSDSETSGLFGKDAEDQSGYLHHDAETETSGSYDAMMKLTLGKNAFLTKKGDTQVISFNMAFPKDDSNRALTVRGRALYATSSGAGWVSDSPTGAINIGSGNTTSEANSGWIIHVQNDRIYFFGDETYYDLDPALAAEQWHNIRLEIAKGDDVETALTYKAYIDDTPIVTDGSVAAGDYYVGAKCDASRRFGGIFRLLFHYNWEADKETAGGFYLDDIKVTNRYLPRFPEIEGLGYETEDGSVCVTKSDAAIPSNARKVMVRMDSPVYRVREGDVTITDQSGREVFVSETAYDSQGQQIVLTLGEELEEDHSYRITLSEDMEVYAGFTYDAERTARFSVVETNIQMTVLEDRDFAVSSENTTASAGHYLNMANGMTVYDGGGYSKATGDVPGSDGNCLVIGARDDKSNSNTPRGIIELANYDRYKAQGLVLDFKLYISEKTNSNDGGTFNLKLWGGSSAASKEALTLSSALTAGGSSRDYESGKWYDVRLVVRWAEGAGGKLSYSYDLFWDGECLAENVSVAEVTKLTALRFNAPWNAKTEKYMAIDNLKLTVEKNRAKINGFGTDGKMSENGMVDYRSDIIEVYLTDSISSVTKEQVQLSKNGVPVPLSAVGWEDDAQRLLLRTENPLLANTGYEVTLADSIEVMPGKELGRTRVGTFRTTTDAVNVSNVTATESAEGVSIRAQAVNTQKTVQPVCLLVEIWRGKEFLGSRVSSESLAAGTEKKLSLDIDGLEAGDSLKISAWDSAAGTKLYTRGITLYEKQ